MPWNPGLAGTLLKEVVVVEASGDEGREGSRFRWLDPHE